jgi:hypothetical protein
LQSSHYVDDENNLIIHGHVNLELNPRTPWPFRFKTSLEAITLLTAVIIKPKFFLKEGKQFKNEIISFNTLDY